MSLKERIARIIEAHEWNTHEGIGESGKTLCDCGAETPGTLQDHYRHHQAQAIIDELGLEIETKDRLHYPPSHASSPTGGTRRVRYATKWENQ